jgi:hypothetical protein
MVVCTRVVGGERRASLARAGGQLAVDAPRKIGSETGSRRGSDSEPISRRVDVLLALRVCVVGSGRTCRYPAFLSVSCRYPAFLSTDYRTHGRYPIAGWRGPLHRRAGGKPVATTLGKVAQHAESNSRNTPRRRAARGASPDSAPSAGIMSGRSYGNCPDHTRLGKTGGSTGPVARTAYDRQLAISGRDSRYVRPVVPSRREEAFLVWRI